MDAGRLSEQIEILELIGSDGGYRWSVCGRVWAKVEQTQGRSIFSTAGMSAPPVNLTIRDRALTLHNAVRWNGRHCFITDIGYNKPGYLEIAAALAEPVECSVTRTKTSYNELNRPVTETVANMRFPAILTEKYVRFEQREPMSAVNMRYALVTPKIINLAVGELVAVRGEKYAVVVPRVLDEHKNEYEVAREKES